MANTAILKHTNGDLYRHLEGQNYKNLRTGIDWPIPDDKAKEIFKIQVTCTELFNKYPMVEELVLKLKLKIE